MLSSYGLKFLNPEFKQLHKHIYSVIKGVISSDLDYHIPLINHPKYLGLVANPINTNLLEYNFPTYQNQIVIFHGINSNNYYKKGNDIFENFTHIVYSVWGVQSPMSLIERC